MADLALRQITKRFPSVLALDNVSLHVVAGEIHAVCGENGAGKSTLMNILSGNLQPDRGAIMIDGTPTVIASPEQAIALGIAIVHQHLSLAENLSVAENIFANRHPKNDWGFIRFAELYSKTRELLMRLQLDSISPRTRVSDLAPAQKQLVEIAKALSLNPSILILDEPTASITEKESKILFSILKNLQQQGVSVIYISHRLDEIYLLANRITVLKDGKSQGTYLKDSLPKNELIRAMVGRDIKSLKNDSHVQKEILLAVNNLSGRGFHNVSFELRKGEIVGFAGLVGAGRTEIAHAIFNGDTVASGDVFIRERKAVITHSSEAMVNGIAYVPEDRKALGLFPSMSVKDNIIAARLKNSQHGRYYDPARATTLSRDMVNKLNIITPDINQHVANLSGGNQQKVVLAKWLLTNPDILIVDEPTHGIDIGARFEIYELLKSLAREQKGILIISSDLPELLGLCDRIIVIRKGTIAGEFPRAEATEEKIMTMASI